MEDDKRSRERLEKARGARELAALRDRAVAAEAEADAWAAGPYTSSTS
jgi:hypothetical protein